MWKVKGYRGKRTDYRHAYRIKLTVPTDRWDRTQFLASASDRIDWCEEHCTGEWSEQYSTFWFEKRNDALMFKLTWGGR
jgi:hypothetical protein